MSIISKELVKLGQSHFWLEIEHVGTLKTLKVMLLTRILDSPQMRFMKMLFSMPLPAQLLL